MNIVGAVLIVAACAAAGSCRAGELRAAARLLAALVASLEVLRSEVTHRLTPLPEAAGRLAETGPAETRLFYARLSDGMDSLGELEFSEIWAMSAEVMPLGAEARLALADLGRSLGRYGAAEQEAAIDRCMESLGTLASDARERAVSGGKLCAGLGLAMGLLLAVVFI